MCRATIGMQAYEHDAPDVMGDEIRMVASHEDHFDSSMSCVVCKMQGKECSACILMATSHDVLRVF